MDVLINDDSMKRIFQLEIRTHFGHAARELVVETYYLLFFSLLVSSSGRVSSLSVVSMTHMLMQRSSRSATVHGMTRGDLMTQQCRAE